MHGLSSRNALLLAFLAAFFGSGMPVVIKLTLVEVPPFLFCSLRLFFASLVLLPFLFIKWPKGIDSTTMVALLAAVLGMAANISLFAIGVQSVSPTVSQILYLFAPILVVLSSLFIPTEKVHSQQVIGIVIGTCGIGVAMLGNLRLGGTLFGTLTILVAVFSHSIYAISSRRLAGKVDPTFQTACATSVGAVITGALHFLFESPMEKSISVSSWVGLLYVGVFASTGSYLLIQIIVQRGSALAAMVTVYIQPVLTWGWSAYVFHEPFTWYFAIGGMLSIVGAFLASHQPRPAMEQ